jgi:hypothetical protein
MLRSGDGGRSHTGIANLQLRQCISPGEVGGDLVKRNLKQYKK